MFAFYNTVHVCVCTCCVVLVQRVAAVLARKRQEEEMKAKKLQQIEEDHKMAEELFKQRQEREVCIYKLHCNH